MQSKSHPAPLRLSCRLELLPGATFLAKLHKAKAFGFDAVALPGRFLENFRTDLREASSRLPLPLSSISLGFEGSLVSGSPSRRTECRESLLALFEWCREQDIPTLNMPPALAQDNEHALAPPEERDALLAEQLHLLAEAAARNGVTLLLEPVNRYESAYLNTLEHAVALCERVGHDALGVTADLFHMQLEERSTPEAIRRAGPWLKCLHVADNTRLEPGSGSLAFGPAFAALQSVGYHRMVELESRALSGSPECVLPASVAFLRRMWETSASLPPALPADSTPNRSSPAHHP